MSVLERQAARARAQQLQQGFQGQTSPFGERVIATAQGPNHTPNVPGPGADPEIDPEDVARTRQETIRNMAADINLSPDSALRLARVLKNPETQMSDNKRATLMLALRNYVAENPDALKQAAQVQAVEQWKTDNIDSSPARSSRLMKAQTKASQAPIRVSPGLGMMPSGRRRDIPQSLEDLPAVPSDSREAVIDRLEKEGVDTISGLGNFWDNLGFAVKLNNSGHQMALMMGVALDDLEEAGIELPEGVLPISVNEDLGAFEFLRPTEDGKVRRTLVEPEVAGLQSVAQLADIEELMAGIYAATAAFRGGGVASKHPFVRELAGDFAGRNVGIMLESIISQIGDNPASLQEIAEAFDKSENLTESTLNTAISRGMTRLGRSMGLTPGRTEADLRATKTETAEQINKNIEEAAETMEALNKLIAEDIETGAVRPLTVEAGSLSEVGAQKATGRESGLPSKVADTTARMRRDRIRTMGEANRRVAERHSPASSMEYDVHDLTRESTGRVNTARTQAVNRQRQALGEITTKQNPANGSVIYSFKGDTPPTGQAPGELAGDVGIEVVFNDDSAHIVGAFSGDRFKGSNMLMFQRVLEDAGDRTITLGDSVSPSAQKAVEGMRRRGFTIIENEGTLLQPDGTKVNLNEGGVYTITAMPGEISAPRIIGDANFDRQVVETAVDDLVDLVDASQMRLDESNVLLREQLGWSDQRQMSDYYVRNPNTSALNASIRRLDNRMNNVLTGTEETEAGRKLFSVIRREVDDEGQPIYSGLADSELDLGSLYNSRARLNQIWQETGDPDIARLLSNIDGLLTRSDYIARGTGRARPKVRATIRESFKRANGLQQAHDELVGRVNTSKLFKKNSAGEYINTDIQSLGRLLANDSNFLVHVQPLLESSPALKSQTREGVAQLYRTQVLESGSGWTRSKHRTFLNKYGRVIDEVFPGEEAALIKSITPPAGLSTNRFDAAMKAANDRMNRTLARLVPDAETINLTTPNDILGAMQNAGVARSKRFMSELARVEPDMHTALRQEMIQQTEQKLNREFFDVSRPAAELRTGPRLRQWFDDNKDLLEAVHGGQYVLDLETVVRGAELDAKRLVLRGATPETQHDLIRVTRSLLGPLSRPQRQITAGNYINQKRMAARILQIYSSPEDLRALKSVRNLGARSDAAMAMAVRLGLPDAIGIPTPDNPSDPSTWDPQFRQQMLEMYDWIDELTGEYKEEVREEME